MAQPKYPRTLPMARLVDLLGAATASAHHRYWPELPSPIDSGQLNWSRLIGPKQLTDAYLLGLATQMGGRFVSLDSCEWSTARTADHSLRQVYPPNARRFG